MARPTVKHLHLASTDHAKTTAFYEAYFGFAFQKVFARGAGQPSATMVEAGVRITRPLIETPFLNFFCADPDGHEVQVYSDPAEL